jgi:putative membrane protein
MLDSSNRARDHLANERTFLAWIRTGVATIVFGFAIGRFAIALEEFLRLQGRSTHTPGLTVWLGIISIVFGVVLVFAGLFRYRATRMQLDAGTFEPAGFIIDLVSILLALFGVLLAGYLLWIRVGR